MISDLCDGCNYFGPDLTIVPGVNLHLNTLDLCSSNSTLIFVVSAGGEAGSIETDFACLTEVEIDLSQIEANDLESGPITISVLSSEHLGDYTLAPTSGECVAVEDMSTETELVVTVKVDEECSQTASTQILTLSLLLPFMLY